MPVFKSDYYRDRTFYIADHKPEHKFFIGDVDIFLYWLDMSTCQLYMVSDDWAGGITLMDVELLDEEDIEAAKLRYIMFG